MRDTSEKEHIVGKIFSGNIFLYFFAFRTIPDDDETYIWENLFHEYECIE